MIVKSADPTVHEGASLKKMLNEIEALLANGYTLRSTMECNGEIFAFLLNESELTRTGKEWGGLKGIYSFLAKQGFI
jgi:type II secretory pathway component PulF